MKVLFIYSPIQKLELGPQNILIKKGSHAPPLGLLYLCEKLKSAGHDPTVYDINVELEKSVPGSWEFDRNFEIKTKCPVVKYAYSHIDDYCETILSMNPDVVGFNLMYSTVKFGAALAKQLSKRVRCIAGGPQCHFNAEKIMEKATDLIEAEAKKKECEFNFQRVEKKQQKKASA